MDSSDTVTSLLLASSMRMLITWCVALIVAGGISALTTSLRMLSSGLISDEGQKLPGQALLDRGRAVLFTLSLAFLAGASLAAGELPGLVRAAVPQPQWWLWTIAWLFYMALLVVGSMGTKALALARPLGYVRAMTPLVIAVYFLLLPLTWPLAKLMDRIVPSLWNLDLSPPFSGSEIQGLLADEETSSHMDSDEVNWARSIFELADTEISEIMVPRIDMVSLDVNTEIDQVVALAAESRFTRLPIYEESPDRILGILHTKDLLSATARGQRPSVRELLRPVHFLPESKRIDEALAEFREGRIHLAVVVDEYGGTAGIVTLEDILEEIVGEIRDEYDQEGELVRILDPQRVVIDPRIDLDDLNEMLQLQLPTEENDTLGGLLYQLCGKVPSRGDSVEHEGLQFTIDRIERQRIRQVTLSSETPLQFANGARADSASEEG